MNGQPAKTNNLPNSSSRYHEHVNKSNKFLDSPTNRKSRFTSERFITKTGKRLSAFCKGNLKISIKSTCKLTTIYLLTGFATYPYIMCSRCHGIGTLASRADVCSCLERLLVAFSRCFAKKHLCLHFTCAWWEVEFKSEMIFFYF